MPQRGEPVVCGRRVCAKCKLWRHIIDFAYKKSGNDIWITKFCWPCKRAVQRKHYHDHKPAYLKRIREWKRQHPERIAGYAAEYAASGKRRAREQRYYEIAENRLRRRKRNRLYKQAQRRAAGVAERKLKSALHRDYLAAIRAQAEHLRQLDPLEREPRLDPAPFVGWIDKRLPAYGSIENLADICEVNPRQLRTLRAGTYLKNGKEYQVKSVGLDLVDRCVLNEGWNDLWEVYPNLYEDESVVASTDGSALIAA